MSFVLLGILNAQAAGAGGGGGFDLLESTVLTSSAASVSFTGLDAYTDYKHLQIRYTVASLSSTALYLQLNNDTANNYTRHSLVGTGGLVVSSSSTGVGYADLQAPGASFTDWFNTGVLDILDFSSTNKNTTLRSLFVNKFAQLFLQSNLHISTSAVTTIEMFPINSSFIAGTRISLYGIKG